MGALTVQYALLGGSGIQVSRLVLGTLNLGRVLDENDSMRILDAAVDRGINFIDTANSYGPVDARGMTEEFIGRWLARRPDVRDRIVLATKVNWPMNGDMNSAGLSALSIRRAVDGSLTRLQCNYIDLYQFHHIDRKTRWDEIWQAIDVLIDQGKIIYTGSSNFAGWDIAEAQATRRQSGRIGLVSEQSLYNLLTREIEREVLPAARRFDTSVIAWSPLQGGLLAGARSDGVRRNTGFAADRYPGNEARLRDYEAFCEKLGVAPSSISLAWLLSRPGVLGPIIGPRTVGQLDASLEALDLELSSEDLAELDRIFPPAGEAPEYYAW